MAQREKIPEAVPANTLEQPKQRRGPRPGTENARRGGQAVREKYGPEFFAQIGSKGGSVVRERHGPEFYAQIGRVGGQATRDQHGGAHYSRIGRMGADAHASLSAKRKKVEPINRSKRHATT